MADAAPLLDVRRLTTVFDGPSGPLAAVDGLSLAVGGGETLALVGESGSGKSVTALSILRLVAPPGRIAGGEVLFRGRDLRVLDEESMRQVRGREIGLIFQEPSRALNPVFTVGSQIAEALEVHRLASRRAALVRATELLEEVGVPEPGDRARDYPHQLSGGLLQRAAIAAALACRPALVVADEPTSSLDVTVQGQVLDLLARLRASLGLSLLLITHDLDIAARMADRVAVMYAGRVVEQGPAGGVLRTPAHPYTAGLLAAAPRGVPGRLRALDGSVPALGPPRPGCRFAPRCPRRTAECEVDRPEPAALAGGQVVSCHHPETAAHA
jgi:oligopeptide/dipeptide ABC transporter ATP-binding protein